MIQIHKAEKKLSKLRIGLAGTSGSGKTYSALLMARGITTWNKICIIDTENGSADLYSHLGDYNVITLTPEFVGSYNQTGFAPENYIECIEAAEKAGMEVIIIDSITHEWDGRGGCLEIVEAVTNASYSKNSYTAWAKVTPRHQKFIQKILQSKAHIITTVRRKQDYEMSKDSNGKTKVTKVGLKEITREGFEYELTLSFALEQNHMALISKDRTGLFTDKPEFIISEKTGKILIDWANSGREPETTVTVSKPQTTTAPAKAESKEEALADKPKDDVIRITPAQTKKIFAMMKQRGIESEDAKVKVKELLKVESFKDITKEQAMKFIDAMQDKIEKELQSSNKKTS